ncbi:MAG: phosphotransferase family protein [Pseudomonadales bacterium]|jgi:aminoglycoside phosphotransferase (APT) family kinase protein|nr:phosphotransferase family protein [Pseudomonadales bacterium]MDP6469800.1 phosphotransferase family protein [Pseudomonadales bacterium]MDP6827597.1 phosphotransferase family protein [Pseudomonadales bacterium]MDP6971270.1 phosphotransferase family protein [Pseudomonadales bacterium]
MTDHDEGTGPEGYDVAAVEAWIADNIPALKPPLIWRRLLGGHSNLTYRIDDSAGQSAVIRRPPQGQLLPKAHDMGREWALISALGPTSVPVPAALGFCESPDVTGAWFYVMGLVDGHPLYSAEDTRAYVPEDKRCQLAFSFIDVLGDLHDIDPDSVGLGDLGKKDNYVGRQLKTWYRSWTASMEPANYDDPRAHEMQRYFLENLPEQEPAKIVHGDYGVHNCLVGRDCTVAAVVDWEISTLGDPLADLAYALNIWPDSSDELPAAPEAATTPSGFPERHELAERYAERTGRDLSKLDYYCGFNRWKSAAIVHGVYARYVEGKKSTDGIDLEEMRDRIGRSLALAEQAVNRLHS